MTVEATRQTNRWPADKRDRVAALWREGKSATQIMNIVGAVSRSAVIGLVHRMQLKRQKSPRVYSHAATKAREAKKRARRVSGAGLGIRKATQAQIDYATREFEAIQRRLAEQPEVALVKNVVDLEPHHCRWPVGEPTRGFCGCQKQPGTSYCAKHLIRAHAGKDLARTYANMAGAHIDMHVFGLEELVKEHAAA